jgi:hypothetical protein
MSCGGCAHVAFSPTPMCPAGSVAQPSAEITAVQRTSVSSITRRNDGPLVFQLHPEIIVEIFGWLQHRQGTVRDDDRPWKTYDPEWTRVMAVCRLFRDIAVGALSLWTTLDYEKSSDAWRELCFTRSGAAALAIHGHGPSATKYLSRARTAHLRDVGEWAHRLCEPAPSLRILKVALFMVRDPLLITTNMLGGHVRSLVSLTLCHRCIHLHQAPFMPTLRRLEVDGILLVDGMHTLGGLLNDTPALEQLVAYGLCVTATLEPIAPTETLSIPEAPVALPHLASLIAEDGTAELAALLRMLSWPQTLTVQLDVHPMHTFDASDVPNSPYDTHWGDSTTINHSFIFNTWLASVPTPKLSKMKGIASVDVPHIPQHGSFFELTCDTAKLCVHCDVEVSEAAAAPICDYLHILHLVCRPEGLMRGVLTQCQKCSIYRRSSGCNTCILLFSAATVPRARWSIRISDRGLPNTGPYSKSIFRSARRIRELSCPHCRVMD